MRSLFIIAFLAAQIYLPLSYYLKPNPLPALLDGGGASAPVTLPDEADPFDERFAWRMFSPIRVARCDVDLYDATSGARQPVSLGREIHFLWVNLMKRARGAVFTEFARWRCPQMAERSGQAPVLQADVTCHVSKAGSRQTITVRPFSPDLNWCDPT